MRDAQRVAAYGVAVRQGSVLLTRASGRSSTPGLWCLPGGGVEHGEDPRDTVRREVAEETGLRVAVGMDPWVLSDVVDLPGEGTRLHTVRVVYPVTVIGGDVRDEEAGSTDHAEWTPLDQALTRDPMAPFTTRMVKRALAAQNNAGAARPIRNVAVGLVVRDGHVLAEEYPRIDGHHRFLRAIGGGIAFGERAADAVVREFHEELGVAVTHVRLLDVTENLFEIVGEPGHEVVHIFAVASPQLDALPLDGALPVRDADSFVGWHPIERVLADDPPLYPVGAARLAAALHDDTR
ncbi:NUDIX domain-containing protein [Xylanimonas ulmi]|uniref:ADP-ribose pyrophosphatase YjhB (NUDIX family) n=1 Tax=Xylanimonas ulmi TaxID=228973 RepID=A0A4Q7M4G7_9MICO|nr:NUDIX domain-containing protein [Xylanibacterium ulmi]RZS60879.1 ADP-ribose pyrophosphatase YjhB (NUDIX family) [Xylanibacterium ulmi]